jgi:para-aminobenzoate synthetase
VAGPARPSPRAPLPSPFSFVLERDRAAYEGDVSRCLEYIAAGESYEICLTNRLRAELPAATDVLGVYLTLRLVNPAPYAAFLRLGRDTAVCCSSPERFLRASADGSVESKPIKGTRPRGSSVEEDAALSRDLRTSEKDRSENLMIVDLVRNDLGRTCAVGSITVPALMRVETYASVHQLVSTVRGRRRDGVSTVRCIREAYPMGSMTGAPKVRTLSLIDGLESSARGVYSGTIGYLSLCGAADMNVVIRTAVVRSGTVEIGVGGAVVALSSPEEEFAEILVKGRPIMQAIALAVTGSSTFVVQESSSPSAASATHVPPDA